LIQVLKFESTKSVNLI